MKMETCAVHSDLAYTMVCSTCSDYTFVCRQCIENEHKGHTTEPFESTAHGVLERLRREKADNVLRFKEVKLDLKTCATLREKERIKSGETRRNIERRRDHLKQAVDEIADKLLDQHEASTDSISKVFDEFERQVEEKVKSILKFQNELAHLENSSNHKFIIETGKHLAAPSLPCFKVPSNDRITLKQEAIDRVYIQQMFGEEDHEDIRKSFLSESLEHRENQQSSKVNGSKCRLESTKNIDDVQFENNTVSAEHKQRTEGSASLGESVSHSWPEITEKAAFPLLAHGDTETSSCPAPSPTLEISDPSNIRKRYASSKRRIKGYSLGEAKVLSDALNPDRAQKKLSVGFSPIENPSPGKTASRMCSFDDESLPRRTSSMMSEYSTTAQRSTSSKTISHDANGGLVFTPQRNTPVRRTSSKVASQDEAGVILSTFQHATSTPTAICPSDCGHSWIIHNNANEIKQISNSGVIRRTVDVSGSKHLLGMTALADRSLLVCSPHTKCIKQVHHPSGHVFELFHTAPLIPVGICVSPTGDILMTLIDKWSYDKSRDSHRVLMKCNSNWKMTAEAKYSKHGENLFVLPYKVSISNNGKLVAVINQTSDMTSHLMLFDIHFTLLLRCIGHENVVLGDRLDDTMTERFNVMDVKFDVTDNLVIIEGYTGTVQVLDPVTCRPLRILVREQGSPWTLAVLDNNMWVGFQDGRVKCLTY
ncbi:uncharacterized protein LOC110444873 [Mizuhopecten yessoensis]|uniref:uncharacterized protein LOC110444873 n=1 Tax=Mizuhopecten yessoensis TaxID=6573 RepID=UPI000B45B232|nr:uncharacterized protein LOC110444873 [Mizuhopecten yessoensis]